MEQGCYNYFTLSCDASAGDLRLPYLMRFYLDLARADRRSNGIASEKVTRGVSRYYEAVVAVLRPICQEAQFHAVFTQAIFDVLKDRSSIELLMATAEDDDFVRDDWFSMWADLQGNVGDAHYRGLISDLFRPFASLSRRVYYCDTANQVVWTAVAFGSLTQAARSWQMGFYPAREAAPQTTESLAAPTSKAPLSAGPTEDAPQAADQAFSLSRKRLREPL
ncbi:hypothetical protein DXG03_006578 [Asterophora parasitica]|uniref:Uncharacterized protein n=1 Tax=Asterophora parasitica TaxID=117018 RepID=A0A9P7G8N6_9AGAR|nr:hypothetical protein DXG03_006578 [Asterophora parasitica]